MAVSKELQILLTAKNKADKELKKAQKTLDGINGELKAVGKNSKELDKLKKPANSLTKEITQLATGFFASTTAMRFFKDATTSFLNFEKEMRRVNTITRLGANEFKQMSKEVEELSLIVPFTAQTLSTGLFDVASAGISAGNQMAFLGQAAKFAAAGGMQDVTIAVQGLTAVIKGFGLAESDATRISDLFFKTNELGQTTVEAMASSIQGVTTQAKVSGVQLEELFAVYATLTGVTGTAENVTVQLKGALNAIAAPTVEARKKFDELGIEVGKAAIEEKGLAQVSKEIFDAVGGDIEQLRKLIPEIRGAQLITALATTQFETFNDKLELLQDSSGSTEIAFREMMLSQQNQLKLTSNEWDFFRKRVGKVTSFLAGRAGELANSIVSAFKFMLQASSGIWKTFILIIATAWNAIVGGIKIAINNIIELFNKLPGVNIKYRADVEKNTFAVKAYSTEIDRNIKELKDNSIELFNASKKSQEFKKFKEDEAEKIKILNDIINDETKATKLSAKEKEKAKKEAEKLAEANKKLIDTFDDLQKEGVDALKDLAFEHEKSLARINKNIDSTINQLSTLKKEFKKAQLESQAVFETGAAKDIRSLAEQIVDEEEKAADLRKSIESETDAEKRSILQKELEAIEQSFEENAKFIETLDNELTEVRRINSLSNINRAIEEFNKRRVLAQKEFNERQLLAKQEFNLKRQQLQLEINDLVRKGEQEIKLSEAKSNFINDLIKDANNFRQEQLKNTLIVTRDVVEKEIELFKELARVIKAAQQAKGSQFIPASPVITPFANGGIVTKPTLGLVGEAGPEAIVPLNRGLAEVGGMIINITGTFLDEDSGERVGNMIISKLKENNRL